MSAKVKILAGAAGLAAAVALATPATAQYYPGNPGYGYNNGGNGGGFIGAIINQVLGYGRYPYGNYGYNNNGAYGYQYQQSAVQQCARAVEARLNGNGYGAYGNPYSNGYNSPYGNNNGYNNGYGYNGQNGYNGYNNGYNNGYANGGARVVGISRVDRKSYGFRVYGVATDRFGNGDGYRGGYGQPTIKFDCKVQANGYIRDMNIDRDMDGYRYGYGW